MHGTDGEPGAPEWPPLELAEVTPVLAAYGLDARRLAWRSPRPLSAAGLVDTGDRVVFVKRSAAAVRTAAGLQEEHAFAAHLRSRGVPAPEVLATPDGTTALPVAGWTWEVHARAPGEDTYRDLPSWRSPSTPHARALGAALARLALAAADCALPPRRPQPLVAGWQAVRAPDLLPALEAHVAARPLLAAALRGRPWRRDAAEVLGPLHARLAPYAPELEEGWTHGDGHASNVTWSAEGDVCAVLDLGLADRTTAVFDLATAIERNAVSWLDPFPVARLDLVDALVEGWAAVRPLSEVERRALPELLALVHVEFALSEVGYYEGVVGSAADAELAYAGYLLGHARWFAGPGQGLLEHLRRLAPARVPGRRTCQDDRLQHRPDGAHVAPGGTVTEPADDAVLPVDGEGADRPAPLPAALPAAKAKRVPRAAAKKPSARARRTPGARPGRGEGSPLAAALRALAEGVQAEVDAIERLSDEIDVGVRTLNALREDLAERLEHLDELRAAARDVDLVSFDEAIAPRLPQEQEHFPERVYGT